MTKLFVILLYLAFSLNGTAQSENDTIETDTVLFIEPIQPQFPGGYGSLIQFISDNLEYPEHGNKEGTVYVRFFINEDGRISEVNVVKGIDKVYNKAAKSVVKKMPDWAPADMFGKTIGVYYVLPIKFNK